MTQNNAKGKLVSLILGGDVTGTLTANTVDGIQNVTVKSGTPNNLDVLAYRSFNNQWQPLAQSYSPATGPFIKNIINVDYSKLYYGAGGTTIVSGVYTTPTYVVTATDTNINLTPVTVDGKTYHIDYYLVADGAGGIGRYGSIPFYVNLPASAPVGKLLFINIPDRQIRSDPPPAPSTPQGIGMQLFINAYSGTSIYGTSQYVTVLAFPSAGFGPALICYDGTNWALIESG